MQCFHVIYIFYDLHYFTFLTITFETYNNIDSKTKVLFTLPQNFLKFSNLVTKIFFSQEKIKRLINGGGPNTCGGIGTFFEKTSEGAGLWRAGGLYLEPKSIYISIILLIL